MAKSKRSGKAHVGAYARYKTTGAEAVNRKRKLERVMRKQPNNEQIPLAIKSIAHRRKIPTSPFWHPSMVRTAQLVKQFTGKFDKNYFSADPVVQSAAAKVRKPSLFAEYKEPAQKTRSMFSLMERARWKS